MQLLETVPFLDVANPQSLHTSQFKRTYVPYFIGHLRAHARLPGPFVRPQQVVYEADYRPYREQSAVHSHSSHHQDSNSSRQQLGISGECAHQIVKTSSISSFPT